LKNAFLGCRSSNFNSSYVRIYLSLVYPSSNQPSTSFAHAILITNHQNSKRKKSKAKAGRTTSQTPSPKTGQFNTLLGIILITIGLGKGGIHGSTPCLAVLVSLIVV